MRHIISLDGHATDVSYMRSDAFRPKDIGELGEGEFYNTYTEMWEGPDVEEKERLHWF